MPDLLIAGGTVVPMDGPPHAPLGEVRGASLRVRGDRIAEIGDLRPAPGEAVLDARGLSVLPGFVQAHVHFCQTLLRGLADDLPLLPWLERRIWPLEAAHDERSVRASAELSLLELLRGGTTSVQVMETVRHAEASFAAAAATGITAIVGNCLMDVAGSAVPPRMVTTAAEALRMSEELCRAFHGQGRLAYAVSPRFLLSCSAELLHDAAAFAAQRGLRIHTHAAEHPEEVAAVRSELGDDAIPALRAHGLLGARTGLAHCVHTGEADRRTLVETGTAVLHCPSANLKLGSGIAPIAEYRALGLRIGIGADGAPCNNRLSALTELRQAALLQAVCAAPGAWDAEQALWTATRGGALALGLDDVGCLTPGRRADLVLFDLRDLEPGGPLASRVVYSASEAHVRHVVLGGEVVVRDFAVTALDAEAIRARAAAERDALLQRAGLRA